MNKICARCEKTVYPTEELKCLDKVWHKGCFKCQECGMTLNMRTYKGYGKLPYCEAHVPKAKHTTMAETPELKRIAENTKLQSNVNYHADFEKSKGKFTQVADDPETLRIKANTRIISNVAYHGDLEKKAQMEKQRQINDNGELVDVPTDNYHHQLENYATEMLPPAELPHLPPKNHYQIPTTQYPTQTQNRNFEHEYKSDYEEHNQNKQGYHQNKQDYHQHKQEYHQNRQDHHQNLKEYHQHRQEYQNLPQQYQDPSDPRQYRQQAAAYEEHNHQLSQQLKYDGYQSQHAYMPTHQHGVGSQQRIGRIQDYDPLSDGPRVAPNTQRASATLIYNSDPRKGGPLGAPAQWQPQRLAGDREPLAAAPAPAPPRQPAAADHSQRVYVAMYDYQANDSDEVSFREGDLISNVSSIDEGWMTGQVLRTGQAGMLPANYVELAHAHAHAYSHTNNH